MFSTITKALPWNILQAIKRGKTTLPDDVAAVIEAASITKRFSDYDDEGPRMAVALGGPLRGMFIFSTDEAAARIRARWPWLNDLQVKRAVGYLEARVRIAASPARNSRRKNWVMDY